MSDSVDETVWYVQAKYYKQKNTLASFQQKLVSTETRLVVSELEGICP